MNIKTIAALADDFGKYAVILEEPPSTDIPDPEAEQVKKMTIYSLEKMTEALKAEDVLTVEMEPMLLSVSEWIGNLMLAVTKNTYLYVYNYSKKKMQTNFQAAGITIEY